MCEIRVVNKHRGEQGQYIGRPSPLGNPFAIGRDGSREDVIAKYREWFDRVRKRGRAHAELVRLYRKAQEQGHLELQCWCAPLPCHGDVIKEFLDSHLT